ncbi:MAG: CpsD/CapB family tyrosine-protein kinase [Candidatus Omnitrophota bacterium]
MGKITDALKKAAEERLSRIDKLDEKSEITYQFVAQKTVDAKYDPRIVTFYDLHSTVAEQYRTLRTNIQAINSEKPIKAITITSSIHSEGKSVTSINLAVSMAHDLNKKRILLVDADLRRGKSSKYIGIKSEAGLSEVISNGINVDEAVVKIGIDNLMFLPAGKVPHNPAELLNSMKFKNLITTLKEKFDYVIFDSPPIIPVTDAGLIGAQTDGVVMVIQANRTQRGIIKHGEDILRQARVNILGFVLTNVQYHIPEYIYRYL